MEEYNTCPICYEVPEKEIYQCSAGHIICNECIANLTECPQCRTQYGATRVRNRVLESLLDSKELACQFINRGCAKLCKRNEISSHINTCSFNPDTMSLCKLLDQKNCKFTLGGCTRDLILSHFKINHDSKVCYQKVSFRGNNLMAFLKKEMLSSQHFISAIVSLSKDARSPLFLFIVALNRPDGFLSSMGIQIWGSKNDPKKYKMEIRFNRENLQSSNSSDLEPFPLNWSLKVSTIKEAECILKTLTIGVPIAMLQSSRFGERDGDKLLVEFKSIDF